MVVAFFVMVGVRVSDTYALQPPAATLTAKLEICADPTKGPPRQGKYDQGCQKH